MLNHPNHPGLKPLYAIVALVAVALAAAVVLMDRRLAAMNERLERIGERPAPASPLPIYVEVDRSHARLKPAAGEPNPGAAPARAEAEAPPAEGSLLPPAAGLTPQGNAFARRHGLTPAQWGSLVSANKEWVEAIHLAKQRGTSALPAPLTELLARHEARLAGILVDGELVARYHEFEKESAIFIATVEVDGREFTAIAVE